MVRSTTSLTVLLVLFLATAAGAQQKKAPAAAKPSPDQAFALQIALDRAGFSPGEIDGKGGNNTDKALRAFQKAQGLTPTGELDSSTQAALGNALTNPTGTYMISAQDADGPFVKSIPTDMVKKADLPSLGYTSIKELLAERFHVSPALLVKMNPGVQFNKGDIITVPNVEPFVPVGSKPAATGTDATKATANNAPANANGARGRGTDAVRTTNNTSGRPAPRTDLVITVTDATKSLQVEDASGKVVFHAPVTVGSKNDPLPVGEWKVNGVQRNPTFNYNPDLFWDANPSHTKAKIAAGPNNPVGAVWIDLSKEHYGIHGTPEPSRIGYTESHGCIRLTNWDAARLAAMVAPGTKVILR